MQGLQKNNASNINEFSLLGVNVDEENVFKSFIIGFVDSCFEIDDNYPYNLTTCGVAGVKQIEDVQECLNNVLY